MSNKYACACSHTWQNSTLKDTWVCQQRDSSLRVSVPDLKLNFWYLSTWMLWLFFVHNLSNYWSFTHYIYCRVLENTNAGKNNIDWGNEHKSQKAFQKQFNITQIIQNLSLSLTESKQRKQSLQSLVAVTANCMAQQAHPLVQLPGDLPTLFMYTCQFV